jgi:hypothetical protein
MSRYSEEMVSNINNGTGVVSQFLNLHAHRVDSETNESLFVRARGHQEVLSSLVRHGTVSSSYLIGYGLLQRQNAIF